MYIGNDPSTSTDGANYNIAVGTTALDAVTTGYSNTAIGYNALTENLSANRNTAVGSNALKSNTTGITNVAVGSSALERNTTANRNTAVGHASSYLLNSGQNNVSLGYESSKNMTSANNNVIIGSGANPSADTGTSNQVAIGYGVTGVANNSITLGNSDVTAVYMAQDEGATVYGATFKGSTSIQTPLIEYTDGDDALTIADGGALTTSGNLSIGGSNNELRFYEGGNYVGFEAPALSTDQIWVLPAGDGSNGQVLATNGSGTLSFASAATSVNGLSDALVEDNSIYLGQDPSSTTDGALRNIALGSIALDAITTGDNNVAVGYNALTANTTGSDNMGVGYNALKSNVGGQGNSAIGSGSLASNTSGNYNTAVGSSSLNDNNGGARNVAIGNSSLRDNSSGNDNTSVGKSSGQLITTGDDNVTLGHEAGILLTTGSKNVIIGSDSDPSANSAINQATIGYGVTGQADNSVTLGNADVTAVYMAQDKGATVYAAGADLSGSGGLILENDETITNSTDGTVLINGIVAGGTGSAAGVFTSNGDNDLTIKTGNSNTGSITITDGANENISIAPNGTGKTDFNDSPLTGYGADLQTESGTSKTLAAADNGTIIVCSSNSAVTITVPASLPTGFNCMIIQSGSGQVSLSASSTTLNNRNGTKTAGQHAIMTVVHLGSDAFVVSGDVTS